MNTSHCQICNTSIDRPVNRCPACEWDLSQFPIAFDIPTSFQYRLKDAIASAQKGWQSFKSESEKSTQAQQKFQEVISQQSTQLEQLQESHNTIASQLKATESKLTEALAEMETLKALQLKTSGPKVKRSALTYGFEACLRFDSAQDPASKKVSTHGIDGCINRFKPVISKGQQIEKGLVTKFCVVSGSTNPNTIYFYATEKDSTRYTDECGVYQIGQLSILLPKEVATGELIDIEITYMGGIELQVAAKHDRILRPVTSVLLLNAVEVMA